MCIRIYYSSARALTYRCSGTFYPPAFLSGRIGYSIPKDKHFLGYGLGIGLGLRLGHIRDTISSAVVIHVRYTRTCTVIIVESRYAARCRGAWPRVYIIYMYIHTLYIIRMRVECV